VVPNLTWGDNGEIVAVAQCSPVGVARLAECRGDRSGAFAVCRLHALAAEELDVGLGCVVLQHAVLLLLWLSAGGAAPPGRSSP